MNLIFHQKNLKSLLIRLISHLTREDKMNIKKWNTYLVSTVLILLILAVLILIKILSSNVKGFE